MKRIIATVYVLLSVAFWNISNAQDFGSIEEVINAEETIAGHTTVLSEIAESISGAETYDDLEKITKELSYQDICFDAFYSAHLNKFADNASVMTSVAKYQDYRNTIDKELSDKSLYIDAKKTIAEAAYCLSSADTSYAKYLKQAKRYSLVKQSAKLLKKVQAKEQVEYAKIQAKYSAAAASAEAVPELADEFADLEDKFTTISVNSETIQGMEYKSPIERAKDWLMSFAAIAILLMFANMVQARIDAAKKAKENLKKMQEAMNENNQDIPSI